MRLYFGVVEDNNDPLKSGRYRVRVYFIHTQDTSKLSTDNLYWSLCMLPSTSTSMNGIGQTPNLEIGSHVMGTFIDEYKQQFVILGTFYGKTDIPDLALSNYPNNNVTVTKSGHALQFNNTTNEVILSNKSGSNVNINSNFDIKSVADTNINSDANFNLSTSGNLNVNTKGNNIIYSDGDLNLASGSIINISAPSINLNPSFSIARPSFVDLQKVTVVGRKPVINSAVEVNSGISYKDDLIVEQEEGNICKLDTPTNLYDDSEQDLTVDWDIDQIKVLFEEIGIDPEIYDGEIYWGVVWLGMALKRSGYKYLKTALADDYLKYTNSSDIKKELDSTSIAKGDVIIFTRGDSAFVGVYSGNYDENVNGYECIVADYNERIEKIYVVLDSKIIKIKRIIRPRACNDNAVVYNGKCDIPQIKTGYMIDDPLIALALNIYHESRGEKKIFDGEQYPRGQVAVAWCTMNRLKLAQEHGGSYSQFYQPFRGRGKANPKSISGIVFGNFQFSWANALNKGGIADWKPAIQHSWCLALEIAEAVINGKVPDPTDINNQGLGNIFYYAPKGMLAITKGRTDKPHWYNYYLKRNYKVLTIENQVYMIPPSTKPPL